MGTVKALRFPVEARWIEGRLLQLDAVSKPPLTIATPPEFKHGVAGVWSPEELLAGAVASCYELTLVAFAERRRVPLHSLEVDAAGHVEHAPGRGYGFTVIELDVALTTAPGYEDEAAELARVVEEHCIVGRALEIPVHVRVDVSGLAFAEAVS